VGEDVVRPGGIRNMANPGAFGDPDHYSKRFIGTGDNGGVHLNATIVGTRSISRSKAARTARPVWPCRGSAAAAAIRSRRPSIGAFTQLLPSNATFSVARAATIQAAQDLYGGNSAALRAVTQAWTAVGVN
jgi:thermolysin